MIMKFSAMIPLLLGAVDAKSKPSVRRRLMAAYSPGNFSDGNVVVNETRGTKMFLSNGLMGRVIAYNGEPVLDANNKTLAEAYHEAADGGDCIEKPDGSGYYYVSNVEDGEYPETFNITLDSGSDYRSQFEDTLTGGVYALEFNSDHELVGYNQILKLTAGNCAGGATPWGSWISCEERAEFGQCWQTDPAGVIEGRATAVTPVGIENFGKWEAFAWDDTSKLGYTTNDEFAAEDTDPTYKGAIVRFTPDDDALACLDAADNAGKWCALESGSLDYLMLGDDGTFEWVSDLESANPEKYGGSEGLHVEDGIMTFVTIVDKLIFELNLADNTYTSKSVPFTQEPDNIRIFGGTLYICTDGDENPGDAVWGVDDKGAYKVFYEEGHNYPAGVAFSPDGMRMYVSMWGEATWEFWREDGLAFDDETAKTPVYEVSYTESDSAVTKTTP